MIPVRIVESNPLLNAALRHMVNQEQDLELTDDVNEQTKGQARRNKDAVTLLGLDDENPLPGLNALRKSELDESKVIVLTGSHDHRLTQIALDFGANGIASKSTSPKDLASLIRSTSAGYRSVPDTANDDPFLLLSDAEENIVRLTCLGLQRKEMAEALSLSEGTIKRYVSHILALTEYDTINHLAMDMVAQGTIHPKLTYVCQTEEPTWNKNAIRQDSSI